MTGTSVAAPAHDYALTLASALPPLTDEQIEAAARALVTNDPGP